MDSRRRARAPYRGWVELTLDGARPPAEDPGAAVRLRAEGQDLSTDGLGVALAAAPPVDTSLVSEFALPGIDLPLELRGRVVWRDPGTGRAGLRFERVDPGLAELISNFVAGRL